VHDPATRPRLDLDIEAEEIWAAGLRTIVAKVSIKNIGISGARLFEMGSGLRFSTATTDGDPYSAVDWNLIGEFSIFGEHAWIETGETIHSELVVPIPKDESGFLKIELRVVTRRQRRRTREPSSVQAVVALEEPRASPPKS